jgi:hypothetical protein
MSNVLSAMRPALKPWRLAVLLVVVVGLAVASVAHLRSSGDGGGKGAALTATGGGQNAAGSGGGQNGKAATNGNSGNSNGGANPNGAPAEKGGAATNKPGPSGSAYPAPTPRDSVFGHAEVLQSNCAGGYEPGTDCTVYYHGIYELVSKPAGKLVLEVAIDGTVAGGYTYAAAPVGGHQWGNNITFTVPQHAKKIVYKAMLEDTTGKVIAGAPEQVTYGYG